MSGHNKEQLILTHVLLSWQASKQASMHAISCKEKSSLQDAGVYNPSRHQMSFLFVGADVKKQPQPPNPQLSMVPSPFL